MKRLIFAVALMFAAVTQIAAQEKKTVLVEEFTAEGYFSDSDIRSLRDKVIQALLKTGRVNVIDITKDPTSDGDYTILKGYIHTPNVSTETLRGENRGETHTMTDVSVNYTITMVNPNSGDQGISFMFKTRGNSIVSSEDKVIADACQSARLSMKKMVEVVFPVKGKILMIDEERNGTAQTVYINLGASNGIKKGQKFDVTVIKNVAGDKIFKTIGTITADEVSETKCLCDVNDGNVPIFNYMNSNTELLVNTREKKGLFKSLGNAMGNTYGGGITADPGIQVQTPAANLLPNVAANTQSVNTQSVNTQTAPTSGQTVTTPPRSGRYSYYGFVEDNGIPYIEPTTNWSSTKNGIIEYMKGAGYILNDAKLMAFSPDVEDDPHHSGITYGILNGKLTLAHASLLKIKKQDVLAWMKAHYTYKGKDNKVDILDIHKFLSRDNKTEVIVNFMNINDDEYSNVSITYTKK